jgi:hypothetical protein
MTQPTGPDRSPRAHRGDVTASEETTLARDAAEEEDADLIKSATGESGPEQGGPS